jgi:hypothetical protein
VHGGGNHEKRRQQQGEEFGHGSTPGKFVEIIEVRQSLLQKTD